MTNLVLEKHQKFTKLFSGDLLEGLGAGLNDNDAVKYETCDPEARKFLSSFYDNQTL